MAYGGGPGLGRRDFLGMILAFSIRMVQQIDGMIRRLNNLVNRRYGHEVRFVRFLRDKEEHRGFLQGLKQKSPMERDGSLCFAVLSAYQIIGMAEIVGGTSLDQPSRQAIAELVELCLEGALALSDRID